jgi:hypothetical protein
MKACLGGFCQIRESCQHYNAEGWARVNAKDGRLCEPGQDGEAVAIRRFRPIGSWERTNPELMRPAGVFDGLAA